jgi:hypothetical protein
VDDWEEVGDWEDFGDYEDFEDWDDMDAQEFVEAINSSNYMLRCPVQWEPGSRVALVIAPECRVSDPCATAAAEVHVPPGGANPGAKQALHMARAQHRSISSLVVFLPHGWSLQKTAEHYPGDKLLRSALALDQEWDAWAEQVAVGLSCKQRRQVLLTADVAASVLKQVTLLPVAGADGLPCLALYCATVVAETVKGSPNAARALEQLFETSDFATASAMWGWVAEHVSRRGECTGAGLSQLPIPHQQWAWQVLQQAASIHLTMGTALPIWTAGGSALRPWQLFCPQHLVLLAPRGGNSAGTGTATLGTLGQQFGARGDMKLVCSPVPLPRRLYSHAGVYMLLLNAEMTVDQLEEQLRSMEPPGTFLVVASECLG